MERLKKIRTSKKMKQVTLGMKVGVSQETISGYETGKAIPPADMLIKLADILNTSIDYLLERTDVKEFNPIRKSDLSEKEKELYELFRALPEDKKDRVLGFIAGLNE